MKVKEVQVEMKEREFGTSYLTPIKSMKYRDSKVTKEQFNRIFRLYKEYEDIIAQNKLTNGEVDIAYRIITESYEEHMRDHTFVEDVLGYNA